MRLRRADVTGLVTACLLMVQAAVVGAAPAPAPDLAPREVVQIQVEALQDNDSPERDAGIAVAWAFAHPDNRRVTGPLPRFVAMLHAPPYADLLGHRSHRIESAVVTADEQGFVVEVITADGRWLLQRSDEPGCNGCWKTSAVAPGASAPSI